jgi:hypothetical protein
MNKAAGKPPDELSKQLQGMLGVYLTAAKLTEKGLTVAVTSRNAVGVDLFVTDTRCQKTWSVQIKTNSTRGRFWNAGKDAKISSPPHTSTYFFICMAKMHQIII